MRKELLYTPHLLLERLAEEAAKRHRLRRLRRTCASWLNHYQIDSLELIELAAAGGARVFHDVGANIGSWTALCRALVPDSRIVAFEPLPAHTAEFRRHTAGWPDVRLFEVALGAAEETRPLYVTSASDASSLLPLAREGAELWRMETAAQVPIPVVTLDGLVAREQLPPPDLIKLDVQGFELAVLQGGTATLARTRWVLAEVSFRMFYERQALFSELAAFLGGHGFEVQAFGHSMVKGRPLNQVDVLFARRGEVGA